ncbi:MULTISPECIES: LysE family translocator [unclassified Campylobacter]|uniref:LysE family translocator n=1 Tax=unclassified Campylobacter TaxID=2593542 RepID=UPI003D337442
MEFYTLLPLMLAHFIALIVPGPDVFLILRTSLAHGFKQSVFACLGVGAGIVIWVFLTAFGLKTIFLNFPSLRIALMVFSVCYLSYLSFLLFKSAKTKRDTKIKTKDSSSHSDLHFFLVGFLTNLSNPKAILYFASIFSRFVDKANSLTQVAILVAVISIESMLCFILLGKIFSAKKAREAFLRRQNILDGICAAIFGFFTILILIDLIREILH